MQIQLARWGNSLGVRIPKAYASLFDLAPGDIVEVTPSPTGLLIEKPRKRYELADLLAGVTRDNVHDEVYWGERQGHEAWRSRG